MSNATGLPNLLDLVLADSEMNQNVSCITRGNVGSDHYPVVTTLKSKVEKKARVGVSMKQWAKQADERLANFTVTDDIENGIDRMNNIFQGDMASRGAS